MLTVGLWIWGGGGGAPVQLPLKSRATSVQGWWDQPWVPPSSGKGGNISHQGLRNAHPVLKRCSPPPPFLDQANRFNMCTSI